MSDALDYLLAARPEAMGAYFSFLKKADTHLDVKTRDLISVITKVAVQTEGGFRQYLVRALRDGCTPDEVLDALLLAFPVLGLAKITWAAEILLDMDIPEFRPEDLGARARWHDVASLEEIPVDETSCHEVDGRHLFVHRRGEDLKVFDSRCPHQVTHIPHLALEGERLTCPKHGWVFDITSGECQEKGKHPLRQFEHKIDGDRLLARW